MSKFGVMVMGPAGAGKSTFCGALTTHLQLNRRSKFYVNLDPAAETFEHVPDLDIRDLISLEDVMDEVGYGPNGGLIYCFEFLLENLDWLNEALESLTEEYLIIFDMPGQIELYTHVPILPALTDFLTQPGSLNVRLCAAYLIDSTFMADRAKFFAGTLSAMSCMVMLSIPHLNILSKMDLVKGQIKKRQLEEFLTPDASLLESDPAERERLKAKAEEGAEGVESENPSASDSLMKGRGFRKLNKAVANLIESFSVVNFLQLDVTNEESVDAILSHIDDLIQYHEAQESREPPEGDFEEEYEE